MLVEGKGPAKEKKLKIKDKKEITNGKSLSASVIGKNQTQALTSVAGKSPDP